MVKAKVSIFRYCQDEKHFSPDIDVENGSSGGDSDHEVTPSNEWNDEYKRWNVFGGSAHPTFQSLSELHDFNRKGVELSSKLQKELGESVQVKPFIPIYENVSVGGTICGFWHLQDMNYGVPVNIQKVPISDSLKGDFMAWFLKLEYWGWLDNKERLDDLNSEGHKLHERLLKELMRKDDEKNKTFKDATYVAVRCGSNPRSDSDPAHDGRVP